LDDGYEARLLTLEEIRSGVPGFDSRYEEADRKWPNAAEKLKFNEALKRMLDAFVGDLICATQTNIRRAGVHNLDNVRTHPSRLVSFSADIEEQRRQTKSFLYRTLYYSPALDSEKREGERLIRELFEFWAENPSSLPASYREKAESEPLPRIVCDYIAGMTDNYIYEQHQKYCAGLAR